MRNNIISNPLRRSAARNLSWIAILLFGSFLIQSQMPDWKFFKDREGHTYFIDRAGKITIADVEKYRYKPVSAGAIDYYLHYGITLVNDHRLIEGLSVLKSILALPADSNRIYTAQVQASETIHSLKKREGTRFSVLDESASLMLLRRDSLIRIINDHMFYSLNVPAEIEIIRVRMRGGVDYRYSGVMIGIRQPERRSAEPSNGVYDVLLAIDGEKFSVRFKTLSEAVERWRYNLGFDNFQRTKVSSSGTRVVYHFRKNGSAVLEGMEVIVINGCFSYCIRLVTSGSSYEANKGLMEKIVDDFCAISKRE
jgi:hypothetical protein